MLDGGAQGVLGWYMVMSGLAERTDVSHFRLSAHLLLALAIMGALIWVALDLRRWDPRCAQSLLDEIAVSGFDERPALPGPAGQPTRAR